jgi:hypothetical protein
VQPKSERIFEPSDKRRATSPTWKRPLTRVQILSPRLLFKKKSGWFGPVPVTTPLRTVVDCSLDAVPEDLVRQARQQGIRRGLFERGELQAALREARKRHGSASTVRKP